MSEAGDRGTHGAELTRVELARVELGGEWHAVRRLVELCAPHRRVLIPIVTLAVLAFLFEGIGIGLLIPLVDTLLGGETRTGDGGLFDRVITTLGDYLPAEHRLAWIAGFVFLLILLKTAVIYAHHALSVWLGTRVARGLRDRLFRRTFAVGLLTVQRLGIGRLHNTIDAQVARVAEALYNLTSIAASLAAASVFFGLLLVISWPLTLAVIAGAAAISLLMLAVRRAVERVGRASVVANDAVSGRIVESLTHHRLVLAMGTEAVEQARFHTATERLRRVLLRLEALRGLVVPLGELLYLPLMFAVLGLGLVFGLGLPALLAFLLLLYRLQRHLRELDRLRVELAGFAGPLEDVVTLLDLQDSTAPRPGARAVDGIARSIRFAAVSFAYGDARAAGLHAVSFTIPRGSTVALVGPSGAGKSTIVGLLFRFFDPTAGRILVDDVPLDTLDLAAWRRCLAYAGQDIELMQGTVRDNIAYGCAGTDDAAIRAALRAANAEEIVAALPRGLDSSIGARGLDLSGGQRQRLGLARALLRRPALLILDEATNALDADTEAVILDRLRALQQNMTTLVIAHRLPTVRRADLVVVLDAGRVIEIGAPAELLASAGAFNRLWQQQTAGGPASTGGSPHA